MATPTKTSSVTAHVPVKLAEKIDLMAERLERSKNWIVNQALSAWIDQEEERSRLTREALNPSLQREIWPGLALTRICATSHNVYYVKLPIAVDGHMMSPAPKT